MSDKTGKEQREYVKLGRLFEQLLPPPVQSFPPYRKAVEVFEDAGGRAQEYSPIDENLTPFEAKVTHHKKAYKNAVNEYRQNALSRLPQQEYLE